MTTPVRLQLVIAFHEPLSKSDSDLERVWDQGYAPLIAQLGERGIRTALHLTGHILDHLARRREDNLLQIKRLVQAKQVEVLGGLFYGGIPSLLPEVDVRGQVQMMNEYWESLLGVAPQGVWLPELAWCAEVPRLLADTGLSYAFVASSQIALKPEPMLSLVVVERGEQSLPAFVLDSELSAALANGEMRGWRTRVESLAQIQDSLVTVWMSAGHLVDATLNDPGARERFFDAFAQLETVLPAQSFAAKPRASSVRLVPGLAPELWPAEPRPDFADFAFRSAAVDTLTRRMLRASKKLGDAISTMEDEELEETWSDALATAQRLVFAAQSPDPFVRGEDTEGEALRDAAMTRLVRAEALIDSLVQGEDDWLATEEEDADSDLCDEVFVSNRYLPAWIVPAMGGEVRALDDRRGELTLIDPSATIDGHPRAISEHVFELASSASAVFSNQPRDLLPPLATWETQESRIDEEGDCAYHLKLATRANPLASGGTIDIEKEVTGGRLALPGQDHRRTCGIARGRCSHTVARCAHRISRQWRPAHPGHPRTLRRRTATLRYRGWVFGDQHRAGSRGVVQGRRKSRAGHRAATGRRLRAVQGERCVDCRPEGAARTCSRGGGGQRRPIAACRQRSSPLRRPTQTVNGSERADVRSIATVDLLRRVRDGLPLGPADLNAFVRGVTDGAIPDYQIAAFLMAVYFKGLSDEATVALTIAMRDSGRVIDLGDVAGIKVDKHSTGGVGDKISLPLAPLVAACGVPVPMVSGRGLGHTGGTLDKLESIPGFRVDLGCERFRELMGSLGVCMIGQTADLAPADKKLYALRDVTATVESIPLITSSILSKKLAAGIDALVLDVKVGSGAFMKDLRLARLLAESLVRVGTGAGLKIRALLTRMEEPLGFMIGNALEVRESIAILRGQGPADTTELTYELGAEMLVLGKAASSLLAARQKLTAAVASGAGLELFGRLIEAQHGDRRVIDDPARLPTAPQRTPVTARRSGFVASIDAFALGMAAVHLGAGRTRAEDPVDPRVGFELRIRRGQSVRAGDELAIVHHVGTSDGAEAAARVTTAIVVADDPPAAAPLIIERQGGE